MCHDWRLSAHGHLHEHPSSLPVIGETVLLIGVEIGRKGHPSTTVEYFQGKVRHMEVDDIHELYLYVDLAAVKGVRKVHLSYVECPDEEDGYTGWQVLS